MRSKDGDNLAAVAIAASAAPARAPNAPYPPPFAARVAGKIKRPLGDLFGLRSFGVNHITLPPGVVSALSHRHTVQDEFIYVIAGELTLVHDGGGTLLTAGMCVGFKAMGGAHQLVNRSTEDAAYLEMGDRSAGDRAIYTEDDLMAVQSGAGWAFVHKDGSPY